MKPVKNVKLLAENKVQISEIFRLLTKLGYGGENPLSLDDALEVFSSAIIHGYFDYRGNGPSIVFDWVGNDSNKAEKFTTIDSLRAMVQGSEGLISPEEALHAMWNDEKVAYRSNKKGNWLVFDKHTVFSASQIQEDWWEFKLLPLEQPKLKIELEIKPPLKVTKSGDKVTIEFSCSEDALNMWRQF